MRHRELLHLGQTQRRGKLWDMRQCDAGSEGCDCRRLRWYGSWWSTSRLNCLLLVRCRSLAEKSLDRSANLITATSCFYDMVPLVSLLNQPSSMGLGMQEHGITRRSN